MKKEAQIIFLLHSCLQVVSTIVEVSRRGEIIRHLLKGGLSMKSKIAKLLYGVKVVSATKVVAKALCQTDQFDEYFFQSVREAAQADRINDTSNVIRLNDSGTILLVRTSVPARQTTVYVEEVNHDN